MKTAVLQRLNPVRTEVRGRVAAKRIYGAVVVLALLMVLEDRSPGPLRSLLLIGGSLAVVMALEAYADALGSEMEHCRRLTVAEHRERLGQLTVVLAAAEWPVALLGLAALRLVSEETAFHVAEFVTATLLFAYGWSARRLSGGGRGSALATALAVGLGGLALAALKATLSK